VPLTDSIFEGGLDVLRLKVWIVAEDGFPGYSGSQKVENVLHTYAHASDARAAATLLGINRDTVKVIHRCLPRDTE
jgi:hypothetical protein